MSNIILPDDPEWNQPIKMGDAYEQSLTPKLAYEKRASDLEKEQTKSNPQGNFRYAASTVAHMPDPWIKNAQAAGNIMMANPMWFSPLHTPQSWQTASRRREINQWARFFLDNEPKVAGAIDFYSNFSMNGFDLECPDRKVLNYFNRIKDNLDLLEKFKMISREYYTLGDVFIHLDVDCPICFGSGIDPDTQEQCNHPGGNFRRILILNPDWIEVQQSVLADEPVIVMVPDEELKRIVFYKQPKAIYDRIPDKIKKLVISNQPIPLSNRVVSHLKHMPVPYGTYGTSLIRRLFTTLAYKTKIMTANWIVAERLILPVRVVKIGSDERPATSADIADVQQQLAATANDPNLTIVTHHNFEYDWFGSSGKILQVTQEMEHIDKEILDGFMLNQSLLNGEMCLPDDHEALTAEGYKPITTVTQDDALCIWDDETGAFFYERPQEIYHYENIAEIYEIWSGEKVIFKCTADHSIVIRNPVPYMPLDNPNEILTLDQINMMQNNPGKIMMVPAPPYIKVAAKDIHEILSSNEIDEPILTIMRDGSHNLITKITKVSYGRSVYCFKTSTGYFVARFRNSEFVSGNSGYQSAQVGVETLIRRIESWRYTLASWAEKNILLPIAEMQGFIDKEKSEELGETVFVYPKIKWWDLNLKDKTQWHQILMQLHDKGVLSTQTLCEELDLDYDQEIERLRYEQTTVGPMGGAIGQGGAGAMPGMGLGGGGAGGPGGGGDMGMGMGGMPGAGGAMGMGGGMDMGGGMGGGGMAGAAPAMAGGGKVMKKGKSKQQEQDEMLPMPMIKLTSIEQKMAMMMEKIGKIIGWSDQEIHNRIRVQFPIANPSGHKSFTLDFAIPHLKLGTEVDGGAWHNSPEQKQDDQQRDNLLAQRGWTILRFNDNVIDEKSEGVQEIILSYIKQLSEKQKGKKAEVENEAGQLVCFGAKKGEMVRLGWDEYCLNIS